VVTKSVLLVQHNYKKQLKQRQPNSCEGFLLKSNFGNKSLLRGKPFLEKSVFRLRKFATPTTPFLMKYSNTNTNFLLFFKKQVEGK